MPATEFSSKDVIVVKLANGYNIGISITGARVEVVERGYVKIPTAQHSYGASVVGGNTDRILSIISTGGTIASKVEYETGAVKPALTAEDLVEMIPELRDLGSIEVVDLYRLLSENMTPEHWSSIAETVGRKIMSGVNGIIVAHGTDTMTYTAAALAFAVRNLPFPIALVGSQRSSDRPSSDAALNLKAAAITTMKAPFGESVIVMHGDISDSYAIVHRGVKARKMHSSRRDAFQSINDVPLAKVLLPKGDIKVISSRYLRRCNKDDLVLMPRFESRVALVKAFPGINAEILDFLIDRGYRGIVIEGTGLGHINESCVKTLERAVNEDVVVVMTTQTLFGRVNMNVYTTGRKLLLAGVIPGSDMLPETALVKLSWLLANFSDISSVKRLMMENLVYEINEIHEPYTYPRWYHGD